MVRRVLVTGGAGFIGSHLCEFLLDEDYEVLSLDNLNDFYDPQIKKENLESIRQHEKGGRFKSIIEDIRNRKAVFDIFEQERPDAVIHLAAMAGVRPSIENPGEYVSVNITGTQVLLDASVRFGVRPFVFASSSSVYGNSPKVPFSETDNVDNPISPYAATKKAGELLCHAYAHIHKMSISCLRFFTVYGPRQRPDLAIHKFSQLLLDGREIPFFGDGTTRRDYTYISDIIGGMMKALLWTVASTPGSYEIFNLGESRAVTLREMIEGLEDALDVRAKLKHLPMQPGDVVCTYADISKAKQMLNYKPVVPFEEGVMRFVQWLRRKERIAA